MMKKYLAILEDESIFSLWSSQSNTVKSVEVFSNVINPDGAKGTGQESGKCGMLLRANQHFTWTYIIRIISTW